MPKNRLLIGGAARLCSDSAPVDVPRDDSVCRLPIEPYTNIYMYIECDVSNHQNPPGTTTKKNGSLNR